MVRVTNAVATHRRKKRLLKQAKGFVGDRKNHLRLTADAVRSALAFNYLHRKQKKRDFRRLWTIRIGVGAKINGISYSKLIDGLNKAGCSLNRKMLSEMAIRDPNSFAVVAGAAKQALA
jgi:large subunit ribosomal protein L20